MINQAREELKNTLEMFSLVTNAMAGVADSDTHPTLQSIVSLSTLTGVKIADMTTCLKLSPCIMLVDVNNESSIRNLTKTLKDAMNHDKAFYEAALEKSKMIARESLVLGLLDNPSPEVQELMSRLR